MISILSIFFRAAGNQYKVILSKGIHAIEHEGKVELTSRCMISLRTSSAGTSRAVLKNPVSIICLRLSPQASVNIKIT